MKKLLAMAFLLAPGAAFAWNCPAGYTDTATGCVAPPGSATATASATQGQLQGQWQGQAQGQGQTAAGGAGGSATGGAGGSASQSQQASNAGNAQTSVSNESFSYPRQTPPAIAGDVQPFSCKNARNAGASAPVAGLSLGFSTKDVECDKREAAIDFHAVGRDDLAVEVLCTTAAAKGIKNCAPLPPAPPVAAAPSPWPCPPGYVVVDNGSGTPGCIDGPMELQRQQLERKYAHGFPGVDK